MAPFDDDDGNSGELDSKQVMETKVPDQENLSVQLVKPTEDVINNQIEKVSIYSSMYSIYILSHRFLFQVAVETTGTVLLSENNVSI